MLDETTGLGERRARTMVTLVLLVQSLWVIFFKYLPLDAGLWALQAEFVRIHLFGHPNDGWRLIQFPASNVGAPLLAAFFTSMASGEIVLRLLMAFGAIFLRGLGMLALFRVLRVRDLGVYFLIPVLVMTGLWSSGALPYLLGETVMLWMLVFFLSQNYPRSSAYWILSVALLLVSFFSGLAFFFSIFIVIMIMLEQRRNVHLSQGWLSEPRTVLSLLLMGSVLLILGFIAREPILRISSTGLLPSSGIEQLLFFLTPSPNVLEAIFRYGDILHALVALTFALVLLACFARAYLLAIEEVTWQSRAVRGAGYLLLVLAVAAPLFSGIGIDTSAGAVLAVVLILAGSYSRGPAVRRTPVDRLIYTFTVIVAIASIAINMYSVAAGSSAASSVLYTARSLVSGERQTAREDQHIDKISLRFVMDSTFRAGVPLVGSFSYSASAPIYLFSEHDMFAQPSAFQPPGGIIRTSVRGQLAVSPVSPMMLGSEDRYVDSTLRILAALPKGTSTSRAFGPFDLSLAEDAGVDIDKGQAKYHLGIGKLNAGHKIEMAARQ